MMPTAAMTPVQFLSALLANPANRKTLLCNYMEGAEAVCSVLYNQTAEPCASIYFEVCTGSYPAPQERGCDICCGCHAYFGGVAGGGNLRSSCFYCHTKAYSDRFRSLDDYTVQKLARLCSVHIARVELELSRAIRAYSIWSHSHG